MGCGSQAGCLGPKPREREVYLDLVDTIHQQALKMQVPQKDDPYIYVKGQLSKKGLLRKLIDNLVSHKTNLYECANQILDFTLAATNLCELVASIVVVDRIIDQFFRQQDESQIKQKDLKKSLTNQILPAILAMTLPTYSEVPVDIIQRMNVVYFKIVIVLLQKEKTLKKYVLSSLSNFLSLKSDKILCKAQTFRIFELLIDNIKGRIFVQQCTHIFGQLLSRIKQSTCKEVNEDYILLFIRNWFFRQDKEPHEVIQSYQKVLKELINTYCGNTQLLVRQFTVVLDEVHFQRREADKIEELILTSLDNAESTRNLMRTLAVYIIKYLQVGTDDNLQISCNKFKNCDSEKSKLNGFKLISKWIASQYINIDAIIEYNPSSMINFFVTSNEKSTSESFKLEIKQEYFKVIESVRPQSVAILTNLVAELMKDKAITKQRRELLYSLFQDILRIRSSLLSDQAYNTKIRLILSLERHYHKEMKLQLLSLASKGIKNWNILKIKTNPEANQQFRSRICQFLHSVFDIIVSNFDNRDSTSQHVLASADQNSKKIGRLANLHKFTLEAIKVIKVFNDHHLQCYLLILIDNICQYLKEIDPDDEKDAIILYFLAYIIEYSLFLMNKKQRMSQPLSKLSLALEKDPFVHDLRIQIIQTAKALLVPPDNLSILGQTDTVSSPYIPHSKTQLLVQKYETKVNAIRQLFLIKESQWNEIVESFKQYFGEAARESRAKFQKQVFAERDFNRMSSLNVSLNEIENEKGSTRNEGQESFREIMDKLHQQ